MLSSVFTKIREPQIWAKSWFLTVIFRSFEAEKSRPISWALPMKREWLARVQWQLDKDKCPKSNVSNDNCHWTQATPY